MNVISCKRLTKRFGPTLLGRVLGATGLSEVAGWKVRAYSQGRALAAGPGGTVVIVDPAEYQRRPGEPARPLPTLPVGQAGVVTFLVYEPDDLVLVTRVIWTADIHTPIPCRSRGGQLGGRTQLTAAVSGWPLLAAASVEPGHGVGGRFGGLLVAHGKEKVYGSIP